uniref:HTH CENPB-type domain-containing protein n=2 Tax=Caenorhabditis japonica TaxID=281687 RepID=A0A8R1I5I0_CAEJA
MLPTARRRRSVAIEDPDGIELSPKRAGTQTQTRTPMATVGDQFCQPSSENKTGTNNLLQRDLEDLRCKGVNLTVKQLLAKSFKNYRSRQSLTSERATEIMNKTLSENDVPDGALLSGTPMIPPTVRIGSMLLEQIECEEIQREMRIPYEFPVKREEKHSTLQSALESLASQSNESTAVAAGLDDYANQLLTTHTFTKHDLPPEPLAYPGNHLPWPVLWKSVPSYRQGDIYIFVGDTVYAPMSGIIKAGQFLVPLDVPVGFKIEEKHVEVTLRELLAANGVNLANAQHYRMLQGFLQKAGVHIRADYADRLRGIGAKLKLLPPIDLTMGTLPLICKYPDIYMTALGRRLHGAVVVDTSGDHAPIRNQTFLTTIYSEPLTFELRRQILIHFDAEIALKTIADRYKCTIRSVHETIGTRILIERHRIDEHLLENPLDTPSGSEDVPLDEKTTPTSTIGDVMRPRNKIRRTHYVDLNKLVWKHFKDCQASGVQINGKHLKDQAMRYAKEMGLESFRGSEGWLDAFKRRHRIDLKTMTGFPVCYENDMFDEVDKECRDLSPLEHHHLHQNSFMSNHHHNRPEDFATNFFSNLTFPSVPEPTPSSSSSSTLQNMINMMNHSSTSSSSTSGVFQSAPHSELLTSSSGEFGEIPNNQDTIYNVMRSCQIKVADKEVSHALDTLRTYILARDPPAMSLLVPLQERLAETSTNSVSQADAPAAQTQPQQSSVTASTS